MPDLPDLPRWLLELLFVAYALVITGTVMLERRRPASTLAWVLAMIFLPILGLLAYLLVGRRRVRKRVRLRERRAIRPLDTTREVAAIDCPDDLPPLQLGLIRLALRTAAAPLRRADQAQILSRPAESFAAMEAAIRAAKRNICLEFYIWRGDATGERWIELLIERARAGVKVRLLYDDFGSLGTRRELFDRLRAAGGEVFSFGPLRLRLRPRKSRINFRNHRKILTVDGEIGFLGGLNIGDEYIGRDPSGRQWHDLLVCLTGDAVFGLDAIFFEDWFAAVPDAAGLRLDDAEHAKRLGLDDLYARERGDSTGPLLQVIPSGPDLPTSYTIAAQFTAAISVAQRRCWIATPYFVPDEPLMLALTTAAYRGVDVRLLMPSPSNSDSRLVGLAGRAYYDELLAAGCRIFEYQQGMIHAKCLIIDGEVAAIGSANMDIRSFYLNYEVTAMFYNAAVTDQLASIFAEHLERTLEIRAATRADLRLSERLGESFAKVLSPLL
ncbi:MAG: cardiolipin synthase [Nannocystaceae bacterium]